MRQATEADIPRLIEMGREFYSHSTDAHIGFDEAGTVQMFTAMIRSASACVFITEDGFICGILTTVPYLDKSHVIAQECFWWAGKSGSALLTAFEHWAEEKGASQINISHREGRTAAFQRLYRMRRFAPHEHYYTRAV